MTHETEFKAQNHEQLVSAGKILFLTKDPQLIRRQLDGEVLTGFNQEDLIEGISTDEIIPNHAGRLYTGSEEGYLGHHALTGLRNGAIAQGDLLGGNFTTIVAGPSFGRGSSRIHAPLALQEAGIEIIVADCERILSENCVNCGIYTVEPNSDIAANLMAGRALRRAELTSDLSPQSREIMQSGSLLSYFRRIEQGEISPPEVEAKKRPMTIAEKIIAAKTLNTDGSMGVVAVKPKENVVAVPDQYYGYELQSPPARKALRDEFGNNIHAKRPDKLTLHNDHTALLSDQASQTLRDEHTVFARQIKVLNYEANPISGVSAICHTRMVESHALPGQLILGNDSHTCTVGVLNNLSVGKGALDLAGAIAYDEMVITVPETIRINLTGTLPKGTTTKDLMLWLGATDEFKKQRIGSGRVLEFGGRALDEIPFDDQIKLTNMSIELLGFSGVLEPNIQMFRFLNEKRGIPFKQIEEQMVFPDKNAKYSHEFDIKLWKVEPTVSEPGDTQNGKPLSEIEKKHIGIQKVYIGSCTHGTVEDLKQAAKILKGRKIADTVKLYVQASSIDNLNEAEKRGYIYDLLEAGAELLPIGCGACMNAGPGSVEEGETGLFATNRNFPGRTGKGKTYLSSPIIAASSAVLGYITGPGSLPPLSKTT